MAIKKTAKKVARKIAKKIGSALTKAKRPAPKQAPKAPPAPKAKGVKTLGSAQASKAPVARAKSKQPQAARAGGGRIGVGDRAPAFELIDDSGKQLSSASLRGRPYVLYFYPKDDTPGCTLEACGFRDSLPRFTAKGVKVIGVSPDPISAHERFKRKYGLTFPLLSDPEKALANAYGVWVMKQNYGREYMGIERSTFVVDEKGVIRSAYRGVRVPGHVDAVLGQL